MTVSRQGRGDLVHGEGRGDSPQRKGCRELDSFLFACWNLDRILVLHEGKVGGAEPSKAMVTAGQGRGHSWPGAESQLAKIVVKLARGMVTAGQSRGQAGQAAAQQLFRARGWGSSVRHPATTRAKPSREKGLRSFKESLWVLQRQH